MKAADMPATTAELMQRVRDRLARAEHGAATALAAELGKSRQQLNAWLAGEKSPNGNTTLALLRWIAGQ
jgi:DNA-binding transcriptional regulator YiaG